MFVVGLIAAAAIPVGAGRDKAPTPGRASVSHVSAPALSMVVGDRTVRLIALGGPSSDRLLSGIAASLGAAVDAVETFWGVDWSRDVSVVVAGSGEQFRQAAGGGPEPQWADIAAVTVADHVDPAHRVAVGERIVFAPGAANMSAQALRIVLTHELFHYAARADTALDAPHWLTEGVADFVARPSAARPSAAPSVALTLPSDAELDNAGPQRSLAYDRAWWFARFVADTYGTATLRAFYSAACGAGHSDVQSAIRDVLGTDDGEVLARWREWMLGEH